MRLVALPFACLGLFLGLDAAAGSAIAPAGGGQDALEVKTDAGGLRIRHCKAPDCSDHDSTNAGRLLPIPIEIARQDLAAATFETLPIGEGRSVVHVRIQDVRRLDVAFEAILAGQRDEVVFAGLTGYTRGEEGERSGAVVLVYDRDTSRANVLVGEIREDTRICGQATTPLGARGLDPRTMQLRGATFQRIEKSARDGATDLVAKAATAETKPLAQVLLATGGSAPNAAALTDGSLATSWNELRPGDGHGEFVTMRAPSEVPLQGLTITVTPSSPRPGGAAPRTLLVATDAKLFRVSLPSGAWGKPGQRYDVAFPEPVRTSCVAIVLDAADSQSTTPEVTLTEVAAITQFDRDHATLADVAKELGGTRSDESVAILERAGTPGLGAVNALWPKMDPRGRALAVDVAASAGACEGTAMDLLTRAIGDADGEVRRRAVGRIERCGKAAGPALASAVRSGDATRVGASATLLAALAPALAVDPIGEALGHGAPALRHTVRSAFARAVGPAPRAKLLALIDDKDASPEVRLDRLRAMTARLPELRPTPDAVIAELLAAKPDMATRWLLVAPLAQLARSPDATSGELTRLSELVRNDPDAYVRARAVELAGPVPALAPAVIAAVSDPAPRVREAALKAISATKLAAAAPDATKALLSDRWTFVRVAALDALGVLPPSASSESATAAALGDTSPFVRAAAISALGHSAKYAKKIYERLDEPREDVDVRVIAATTLGALCWHDATDRLTTLALHAPDPESERQERIAMASLGALAALHPRNLEKRIAPLLAKDVRLPVKQAAERAIRGPGSCR